MKFNEANSFVQKARAFFDIRLNSKMDFVTEGAKTVYVDPLGTVTQPNPTSKGHNLYKHIPKDGSFVQEIHFQSGSPGNGVNGLSNEAVISTVLHRIYKQNESFPSAYNQLAILCLEAALTALHFRVKDRTDFGIYDTDKVAPVNVDEADLAHALAILNSIGLLSDIIIKFDQSYGLNVKGTIHRLLDVVTSNVEPSANINIFSAFTMMSTAVFGSGIMSSLRIIADDVISVMKTKASEGEVADEREATDPTTD